MTDQPAFKAELFQNPYLPAGGTVVDAVVTVTASGDGMVAAGGAPPSVAQVIMVDCSGSMASPYTKLAEAKKATATAIDTLREGVPFAIVAGRGRADMVFPASAQLVPANPQTRAAGQGARSTGSTRSGGTAMGTWLTLADHLFARSTAEVKHAILLTDGQQRARDRRAAGRSCCRPARAGSSATAAASGPTGRAPSSARSPRPCWARADALARPGRAGRRLPGDDRDGDGQVDRRGQAAAVDPGRRDDPVRQAGLPARRGPDRAADRGQRAHRRLSDSAPGGRRTATTTSASRCRPACGRRGDARRPGQPGQRRRGAVQSLVRAVWTDDTALSTRINPRVAHYTGQAELADAIQEGLAARDAGDVDTATAKLGRAVQLAEESGHTDTAKLLAKVVDVVDARTGTVRLKQKVAASTPSSPTSARSRPSV